ADELPLQEVELVRIGAPADHGQSWRAVHRLSFRVPGDERPVPRGLDVARDLLDGVVPGDVFPVVGARAPDLGRDDPVGVVDVVLKRCALRAEGAAVGGRVRIAFDMHDGGPDVLRLVPEGVDDDAARYRAVRTDASGLGRTRDLELPHLRARV